MFFTFSSTFEFSALISASPGIEGPGVTVPSIRPLLVPPALLPAVPVVMEPRAPVLLLPVDPEEFAVPAALVPGASGIFAELPAPLGSLAELFGPPTLAGPLGTPLTPAVPAPAEPAFGEPKALPVPAVGPPAAPPADEPPADAPPAPPPPALPPPEPPPPPPPCAKAANGHISAMIINKVREWEFCISLAFRMRAFANQCGVCKRVPLRGMNSDDLRLLFATRRQGRCWLDGSETRSTGIGDLPAALIPEKQVHPPRERLAPNEHTIERVGDS
jgi:hypothetical protein